ncbi:MAG: hypothetical protein JWL61_759 [Gemmatimonadetes bacterium]|nr:hypothetical protein [Gemmatimonadota bacterium]
MNRELGRMRTARMYPLLLLVLPLAGWFLLRSVFGQHVARDLPVVVMDADGTVLSRRIARAVDATPTVRVIEHRAELADVEGLLRRGEAYAVIVLPAGLERQNVRGESAPVSLFTNAQWIVTSNLVIRDVRAAVATLSAEQDVGRRVAHGEAVSRARISSEPIRVELHPLFNPALDYAAFLFIALVPTLVHVFVLLMSVFALGSELKKGTAAEWMAAAGDNTTIAVIGKLLPYAVWYTALGIVLLEVSLRSLDLNVAGSRSVLYFAVTLLVLAYQAIALLLVSLTANLRASTSIAGFVAAPAFAVSGVSFPRFAMPLAGRVWSAALPLSHYLEVQMQQVTVGAGLRASAWPLAALVLFVTLLPTLSLGRMARIARDPTFWGRS